MSRRTAHKWIGRFEREGLEGLGDRHRAPKNSPQKTAGEVEEIITAERRLHPTWGSKKLHELLANQGIKGHATFLDKEIFPRQSAACLEFLESNTKGPSTTGSEGQS